MPHAGSVNNTSPQDPDRHVDAVVLAGGAARRMGGADKPGLSVGGRTLLERVADAVREYAPEARITVVGPERDSPSAHYVREEPPGAGPVPALRAGLGHVRSPWFALLAADLPHLAPAHLAALTGALTGENDTGAVFVDATGHRQWLTGVWHTDTVRAALAGYERRSLHGLLDPLGPRVVVPFDERAVVDCDTPEDLAGARRVEDRHG